MVNMHITIPFPALLGGEHFDVIIKNAAGATVFTNPETNATFTVPLASGSGYQMFVTYDGATNVWCFDAFECVCPTLYSATISGITTVSGTFYQLDISFDYRSASPLVFSCPFEISVDDGTGGRSFLISSFADFTANFGGIYTRSIHLYTDSAIVDVTRPGFGSCLVSPLSLHFACSAPTIPTFPNAPAISETLGSWYLDLKFHALGGDCNTIDVNYTEISYSGSGVPDAGTVTVDVSTLGPLPAIYTLPLNPRGTEPILVYAISYTDCCGNVITAPDLALSV